MPKRQKIACVILLGIACLVLLEMGSPAFAAKRAVSSQNAPRYVLTDLGTLPGTDHSEAFSINNAGQVVGFSGRDYMFAPIKSRPFLYERGKMKDLGLASGFVEGSALWINNQGVVVGRLGRMGMDHKDASGVRHNGMDLTLEKWSAHTAFLWRNGTMTVLSTPWPNVGMMPVGINDQGQIAGFLEVKQTLEHKPVTIHGARTSALRLPLDYLQGEAAAINNHGTVAATAVKDSNETKQGYIRWRGQTILLDHETECFGINDNDQVVGGRNTGKQDKNGNPISHGFLWDRLHGMTDLGSLGGTYCQAHSVNNRSEVVGDAQLPRHIPYTGHETEAQMRTNLDQFRPHAFLWRAGRLYDLNKLITPRIPGWSLSYANAINDRGVIVGWGLVNGPRPCVYADAEILTAPILSFSHQRPYGFLI